MGFEIGLNLFKKLYLFVGAPLPLPRPHAPLLPIREWLGSGLRPPAGRANLRKPGGAVYVFRDRRWGFLKRGWVCLLNGRWSFNKRFLGVY